LTEDRHEALGGVQHLRIAALWSMTIALFLGLVFIRPAWPVADGRFDMPGLIALAGAVLIAAGILVRLWATLYIGGRKLRSLVCDGPYSISRNPLYLGSLIAAAGIGAQSGSLVVAAAFAVVAYAIFQATIRHEERHLTAEHGDDYLAYCARVPRLLPSPRLYVDAPEVVVDTARLYRTLRDGMWFFAAVPAFAVLEWLQQEGYAPVLLRLY